MGVSSSVAAQRKDMAIMNSIKQLRRIYTIPSCPLSLLLGGRLLLHSCGGNVSSPLLFYDFYIALLLYSRKWKVRKKGDTREGGGGRRHLGLAPGGRTPSRRPGSGRYLRFDPEEPRKMISSPSVVWRPHKNPDSARKRRKREEGQPWR